jgi:hypothetical protein
MPKVLVTGAAGNIGTRLLSIDTGKKAIPRTLAITKVAARQGIGLKTNGNRATSCFASPPNFC